LDNQHARIIEAPTFQKTAKDFLSEHELIGLRYVLANNPLTGKESKAFPGMLVLDWRGDGTVYRAKNGDSSTLGEFKKVRYWVRN
jgi:hypothetical protein